MTNQLRWTKEECVEFILNDDNQMTKTKAVIMPLNLELAKKFFQDKPIERPVEIMQSMVVPAAYYYIKLGMFEKYNFFNYYASFAAYIAMNYRHDTDTVGGDKLEKILNEKRNGLCPRWQVRLVKLPESPK